MAYKINLQNKQGKTLQGLFFLFCFVFLFFFLERSLNKLHENPLFGSKHLVAFFVVASAVGRQV